MTGFARVERSAHWGSVAWELRSVNHRYLEVSLRLPEDLRGHEPQFRQQAAARLKRGKVDCTLRVAWDAAARRDLEVDLDLVERVAEAAAKVRDRVGDISLPATMDLLRWPGVVREQQLDLEPVSELAAATLDQALDELDEGRRREGERLAEVLHERCSALTGLLEQVRTALPMIRTSLRRRLLDRLATLEVETEPQRLEQELVIQLGKMDIDEEIDRLGSHLAEVRRILSSEEPGANGRRLDFLMQEFNREANTLGAKSVDAESTRIAVELKVLIEQMREQIQNIE